MTDPYLMIDTCVDRLLKEYQKHRKLIVAVDFDDTVFPYHQTDHSHEMVLDLVRECQAVGFYIVIWTASEPIRFPFIKQFMSDNGIEVDSINENPVSLPFGNHKKIYYNILLDDRAGLASSYNILRRVLHHIKHEKKNN